MRGVHLVTESPMAGLLPIRVLLAGFHGYQSSSSSVGGSVLWAWHTWEPSNSPKHFCRGL